MSHDDTSGGDIGHGNADFERRLRSKLRERYPGPDFPREEIGKRIGTTLAERAAERRYRPGGATRWWRSGTARAALAAAASLLLFVGGAEYGRRTALPAPDRAAAASPGPGPVGGDALEGAAGEVRPVSLSLSIQASGSRYVASLARFAGQAESLSPEERWIAREVALTALYGAALELLTEWQDEESLRRTVRILSATKAQLAEPSAGQRF